MNEVCVGKRERDTERDIHPERERERARGGGTQTINVPWYHPEATVVFSDVDEGYPHSGEGAITGGDVVFVLVPCVPFLRTKGLEKIPAMCVCVCVWCVRERSVRERSVRERSVCERSVCERRREGQ